MDRECSRSVLAQLVLLGNHVEAAEPAFVVIDEIGCRTSFVGETLIVDSADAANHEIPSALAKELRISVITTKRAFDDLERDGFICTVQGKGSFVAEKNGELIREEHLKQAEEKFSEGVELARLGGASSEEIEEMFRLILKGE